MGEFYPDRRKLRAGEIHPGHGELGRRSTRCARAGFARAVVSCKRTSSTAPAAAIWVGGPREVREWPLPRLVAASYAGGALRAVLWPSIALVVFFFVEKLLYLESWTSGQERIVWACVMGHERERP
jgi:hypothetical protein